MTHPNVCAKERLAGIVATARISTIMDEIAKLCFGILIVLASRTFFLCLHLKLLRFADPAL
jgi:hypothetical protein